MRKGFVEPLKSGSMNLERYNLEKFLTTVWVDVYLSLVNWRVNQTDTIF